MSDITARRMQAEADANDDISAKSYQHTSAYQILHSDDPTVNKSLEMQSGNAIREALLRRAKAKEMGLHKLSFESSQIGQGSYRTESFERADSEGRKSMLGVAGAKKRREQAKRERATNRDRKQRFNATGDANSGSEAAGPNDRQEFNTRQQHTFSEPTGRTYSPYA